MNVVIRADASTQIGSGHIMRCLTLAERLKQGGAKVAFICRDLPGNMIAYLAEHDVEVWCLPAPHVVSTETRASTDRVGRAQYARWLGVTQAQDASETRQAIAQRNLRPEWLIVDHYALDVVWERELRAHSYQIMVIDDLADRVHDCDVLLDQNLREQGRYMGLAPKNCRTLIGPRYALLRPQFEIARRGLRPHNGTVSRLLLFFGGADYSGETLRALAAIKILRHPELDVDVILGAANPHRKAVEAVCRDLPNVTIHANVEDMAVLMKEADIFIGAGGTSSWERCCLGLPALVVATADNQVAQSEALANAGVQLYLGTANNVTSERMAQLIEDVLSLPGLLRHMSEEGLALVDGRGSTRVVNHLLVATTKIRRAQANDCATVYSWRNHPDTRMFSFDQSEIDFEVHEKWFSEILADHNRELLIAEHNGQPVGVLRYDIEAGRGLISIYLVPGHAGRGWGLRLLLVGERWLAEERPDVRICEAEVTDDNSASCRVFQAAGFYPHRWVFRKELLQ